jgi:hypothetical protein
MFIPPPTPQIASAILALVGTLAAKIGTALTTYASTIGPTLGNVLTTLQPYVQALSKFANAFLQLTNILKPGEQIDTIGDRALQAADKGIKLDQFDNFGDYMQALRQFELDPKLSAHNSPAAKLVAGLGVATVGLEDQFSAQRGSFNTLWLLPLSNPDYFTPERMQGWLAAGKLGGDIWAYLEKRLSDGEARSLEKALETAPDGHTMQAGELGQLYTAFDSARAQWAEIAQKIKNSESSSGA